MKLRFDLQALWRLLLLVLTFGGAAQAAASYCTAVFASTSANPGRIQFYNPVTGAGSDIGSSTQSNINALALNPNDGRVYFIDRDTNIIYKYNTTNNSVLSVVTLTSTPTGQLIGATFDASGNYYLYTASYLLYKVNLSNGSIGTKITLAATPAITQDPTGTNGDIALDNTGQAYVLVDRQTTVTGKYNPTLYKVNLTTGALTSPVTLTKGGTSITNASGGVNGLAIDPVNNAIYASVSDTTIGAGIYVVNATTGAMTLKSSTTGLNDLASCNVTPDLPTVTKAFSPTSVIGLPASSTLTLTINNPNLAPYYTGADLLDTLPTSPAAMKVATPNGLGGTCDDITGNTVMATAGSGTVTLAAGARINPGSCTIIVNVTAPSIGVYTNTITSGAFKTTTGDTSGSSVATLTVSSLPTLTLTKISSGGTGTFSFSDGNGFTDSITTTAAGTAKAGTTTTLSTIGAATTITETPAAGFQMTAVSCTGMGSGSVTPNYVAGTFTLNAAATASGNTIACTVTNTLQAYSVSGQIYEDYNYGGGAGRAYVAASGMNLRPGVRVELYKRGECNLAGNTLTDASGAYSFAGQLPGSYKVRVVNGFVTSSRSGGCAVAVNVTTPPASCAQLPVQTYINGASQVGGANPASADPALSTGALPAGAQSVASVTVGASNLTGVDFGFNFSTVVNVGDTGQGSLRQFIVNANALTNTTLAQSGNRGAAVTGTSSTLPAARDSSIFMIPSAALTSGVAIISPASALPALTRANVSIDGTTQSVNIGNTNAGTLGTGGTVGYLNTATLDKVQKPEVQLVGTSAMLVGLDTQASNVQVRGLAIYGFGNGANNDNNANIRIGNNFTGTLIEANILGSPASSFTCGAATTTATSNADDIRSVGGDSGTVQNNLIGCAAGKGFGVEGSSENWLIVNNEIRGNGIGNTNLDGIDLENGSSKNHIVRGNLVAENAGVGVDGYKGAGGNLIERNTITGNGTGQGGAPNETPGVRIYSSNNTVQNNLIAQNYGAGVLVVSGSVGNLISKNSIYDNGTVPAANGAVASNQIGIDLGASSDSVAQGTSPYVTKNDSADADTGGNDLLNFPVFSTAQIVGGNLKLTGFARPGSTIELFIAASDASGFGEGKTYLVSLTEGSAADTDTGTGPYTAAALGSDTTNRFAFSVALPSGVSVGTALTATATCSSASCPGTTVSAASETSEFSYNIAVTASAPVVSLLKLGRNVTSGLKNAASPAPSPLFPSATFDNAVVKASPQDVIEYCLVYANTGGAAPDFKLTDNVPGTLQALPDAYGTGLGLHWADGSVIAAGAVAAPTGVTLTSASDADKGSLTTTGGSFGKGVMTLDLGAAGLAAGGQGTVCFQARVP